MRTLMLWEGFEPSLSNVNDGYSDNFKLSPLQTHRLIKSLVHRRSQKELICITPTTGWVTPLP